MKPDYLQLLWRDWRSVVVTQGYPVVGTMDSNDVSILTSAMQACCDAHDVETVHCVVEYQDDATIGDDGLWARVTDLMKVNFTDSAGHPASLYFPGPKDAMFDGSGNPLDPAPVDLQLLVAAMILYCKAPDGHTLTTYTGYERVTDPTPAQKLAALSEHFAQGEAGALFRPRHGFAVKGTP